MKNKQTLAQRISSVLFLLAGIGTFIGYRQSPGTLRLLTAILLLLAGALMLYASIQKK